MAVSGEHVKVLVNFTDNLKEVLLQIKDGETRRQDKKHQFNLIEYWKNVAVIFKVISMEATKLSMVFSSAPPPTYTECEALVAGLEKSVLALVSVYYSLPKSQGITLRKELQKKVIEIIERVAKLVTSVSKICGSALQLQSTGQIWEELDSLEDLSKDNKQATLLVLRQTATLVKDALLEVEEALETGGEDFDIILQVNSERSIDDGWSDIDKNLITVGLGIIKTVKSLLKKTKETIETKGNCDDDNNICELDDICNNIEKLSPVVDEMTIVLYPPIIKQSLLTKVDLLETGITNIIQILRNSHMMNTDDEKWMEFLLKAKQHNIDKIKQALNDI